MHAKWLLRGIVIGILLMGLSLALKAPAPGRILPAPSVDRVSQDPVAAIATGTDAQAPGPVGRAATVPERPAGDADLVDFPNGESVAVTWRTLPTLETVPLPPWGPHLNGLRDRAAKGEAQAARVLAVIARRCSEVPVDGAVLQRLVDAARRTGVIETFDHGIAERPIAMSLEDGIDVWLTRPFRACEAMAADERDESRWLLRAAELGDLLARLMLADREPDMATRAARLTALWQEGSAMALQRLADLHRDGWNDPRDSTSAEVRAFATRLAALRVMRSLPASSGNAGADAYDQAEAGLRSRSAGLRAWEIGLAEALAAQIVRDNPNCCLYRARAEQAQ
jgi:hypothetical protein